MESKEIEYVKVEPMWYQISTMNIYKLYDVLCNELSFEKMIILYRLITTKIETLQDEPRNYKCEKAE